MIHSNIGYIVLGITEFRFFLAQEDMVAVVGTADVSNQIEHCITHVGYDYPLRVMPVPMQMEDKRIRYYVLLQVNQQRFSLAANYLSFVPLNHGFQFSSVPACMNHKNHCVMAVCVDHGELLCASSAAALHAISERMPS